MQKLREKVPTKTEISRGMGNGDSNKKKRHGRGRDIFWEQLICEIAEIRSHNK